MQDGRAEPSCCRFCVRPRVRPRVATWAFVATGALRGDRVGGAKVAAAACHRLALHGSAFHVAGPLPLLLCMRGMHVHVHAHVGCVGSPSCCSAHTWYRRLQRITRSDLQSMVSRTDGGVLSFWV